MKLLLDEMIGPRVAETLRGRGVDAVGVVKQSELRSLPDEAVLEYAQEHGYVVVTRNIGDFARLDHRWRADGRRHMGLVMVTEQAFPQNRRLVGALVQALVEAVQRSELPGTGEVLYLRPTGVGD